MTDKLKMFEQKHGEEIKLDLKDKKVHEGLSKFNKLFSSTNVYMTLLSLSVQNHVILIPCKTCLLNTALEFEEMGSLLRELAGERINKDGK